MLNRLLFFGSFVLSLGLIILVLVGPWLIDAEERSSLLGLFAHDVAVRRTSVACAAGLLVSALIFFRPRRPSGDDSSHNSKGAKRSRSRNVIGA